MLFSGWLSHRISKGKSTAGRSRRGAGLARFAREDNGATAVLFSVLTTVLVGSIAFGIDAASWYQTDRKLQTAADMAAMAAAADVALQSAAGYSGDTAETVAQSTLTRGGVDIATLTNLEVNSPPTSGAYAGNPNAVEVIVSQDVPIFFAGLFVEATPQAQARAVALSSTDGEVCVLALDPTLPSAILISGNSDVQLDCGIGSNSTSDSAILAQGSADVQGTIVRAVGGIDDRVDMQAALAPYANPIANPFADLSVPAFSGCDSNGVSKKHISGTKANGNGNGNGNGGGEEEAPAILTPGVYCGDVSLGSQSETTFDAGVYIFDAADFIVNGQAKVYGDDVTFIFTNSSGGDPGGVRFNGGSDLQLRAPTSGDFDDILFMRDPNAPDRAGSNSDRWIINGSSDPWFDGAIYAPGVDVELLGNADPTGGCFVIVAGTVTFTGNVDVQMTCSGTNTQMAGIIVTRLVE